MLRHYHFVGIFLYLTLLNYTLCTRPSPNPQSTLLDLFHKLLTPPPSRDKNSFRDLSLTFLQIHNSIQHILTHILTHFLFNNLFIGLDCEISRRGDARRAPKIFGAPLAWRLLEILRTRVCVFRLPHNRHGQN